jgi:ATP-dependent helicase/nuclease subunit A
LKSKNILTDHQHSALNITDNIALTANAGSGKTFVLSKRFIEIAITKNIPLRKIAAITFTEKAASELYKKITSQVGEMIESAGDPDLVEKLHRIRRSLVSAHISTIHSFCINLLKEYPVEAELDANFIPVDTNISSELMEMSVDSVIRSALNSEEDSTSMKSLIRLFSSRRIFAAELINLIANRKNVIEIKNRIYSGNAEDIAEEFYNSFIKQAGDYLWKRIPAFLSSLEILLCKVTENDPSNKIAISAKAILTKLKQEKQTAGLLYILNDAAKIICTDKGEIRKLLIRKSADILRAETVIIEDFLDDIKYFCIAENHKEIENVLAQTGKNILYFFDKAMHKYDEKKRSKGYLDFEDILLCTKKLLEDRSVRESVWQKFDYIMIDEYQDTNEIQYEIFLPILNYLKRGNLFVVGDEKQSIYMFRDAELEVFERTKGQILKGSGQLLLLPDSFRMSPGICLFTNYVFRRIFSDPEPLFNEVAHSELVCARHYADGGETALLIEETDGLSEADLISKKILELKKNRGLNWNDAAVLSRKRKSFDELEESFVKFNIPYIIIGGKNFFQRQSIYDIFNYFSFLLDTNNDPALAGILRSPFFNLSDSKLYEIALLKGASFYQKLLSSDDSAIDSIKIKLKRIVSAAAFTEAPALLRMMLEESEFLACLAAKKNGTQETANINKLIKVTINYYSQGFRTLYDYVSFLKTSIEQTEDESQAVIADDSNTVKIMTIHQAKGLEFPAVFLFKAGDSAQQSIVKQKSIVVNKHFGILTKVPLNENYFEDYLSAPVINLNNFISIKKNQAELKRLFYVGITRAQDYLYITARREDKYPDDSFMGLLVKAFAEDFSFEGVKISDKLTVLVMEEESYTRHEKLLNLDIPLLTAIEASAAVNVDAAGPEKRLLTRKITDSVEDEIISATRFTVYNNCPLKYKFTYIDGLLSLVKPPVYGSTCDEEKDEEVTSGSGSIKGRVIHKILQKNTEISDPAMVRHYILREEPLFNAEMAEKLSCEIIADLKLFYGSAIYKQIKNQPGNSEYEVYYREDDYILYGIIDKLLIQKDSITIIDYKTDDIPEDKTSQRASEYFNQLKFYSYIIWNAFNCSFKIFFKIVFIRHPDKCFEKEETVEDLKRTGLRIREMVNNTRSGLYSPDKTYCHKCIYSADQVNCIKRNL